MDGASSEVELKRLLAELRRRPHLLRDPHIARLVSAAVARLRTPHAAAAEESPKPAERQPPRQRHPGVVRHCVGDVLVMGTLLAAPLYLPERLAFAAPLSAGPLLAFVWLFIRAEAIRVLAIEAAQTVRRLIWSGILWYSEAFLTSARRAWRRTLRVEDLMRAWRSRPAGERRSFADLLAFIEAELRLSLTDLGSLGQPPDWSRIDGRLGRLGNEILRWRGDKRLLPSSLRWIFTRAVTLAEANDQASAGRSEISVASATAHSAPDQAVVTEETPTTLFSTEEADRIRARIKSLEEEIQKIQGWNVKKEAEEASRRNLIKEKRATINELRSVLHSLEAKKNQPS